MKQLLLQLKNFLRCNKTVFEKNSITILVTDSGIGGISVANDLYSFFENNHYYYNVDIVYADCRNGQHGYNQIDNLQEKIKLFSDKLFELDNKIKPDIIFIACNTLSVLLNKTLFYAVCEKPIIDICNISLNLMSKTLQNGNGLFILGTKTTIGENYYKNNLIDIGFNKENIVNQLCPNLAKYIERSYIDGTFCMKQNIKWLTNRIKQKKPKHFNNYTISLNCTHYYYALKYFKQYFNEIGECPQIICPNFELKKVFTDYLVIYNYNKTTVNYFVYKPNATEKYMKKISFFAKNKILYFLI